MPMLTSKISKEVPVSIVIEVERLFREEKRLGSWIRTNPVTRGRFTNDDSVAKQKRIGRSALMAFEHFRREGPHDYQLPLTYEDREALKGKFDLGYIVALYARSLAYRDYDLVGHPPFNEYAAGVLALSSIGERILEANPDLAKRYPPKSLPGLHPSGNFQSIPVRTNHS